MDKRERAILFLTSSGHFLTHLSMGFFPGIIEPLRQSWSLNFAEAAHLAFPGYLAFGLGALPFGFLAKHVSARTLILCGQIGMVISAAGAGNSATPDALMYWLLGLGLSASVYHPVGYALLSNSVRARGKAHGYQGVFGNLGIALAPLIGGVCAYGFSWRAAFYSLAIIGAFSTLLSARFPFDERLVEQQSEHQKDTGDSPRNRRMLLTLLAFAITFAGLAYRGSELLLPKHLGDLVFQSPESNLSETNLKGSSLASAALVLASLGQIVGGRLADRWPLSWGYLIFHAISLPFLVGLAFLSGATLVLCAALYGFFALGMQPFENSLVAKLVPPQWRSVGYGIKFVLTFGIGALSVEYVGLLTHEGGSTAVGFSGLIPFVLLILLFASLLHWRQRTPTKAR